mgnify:CR=1 FL=1
MSDFRKPRTDTPIVPQTALFRKVKKAPKKPKGRRGRKPKGKRSGNFVSRQDPNFVLRKADDDARKAREDRQRQTQQQDRLITAQVEDIRDRRQDRAAQLLLEQGRAGREQQAIQLAQDRFLIDTAEGRVNRANQREQLRLQGVANADTQRYRLMREQQINAQLAQQAAQGAARAGEAQLLLQQGQAAEASRVAAEARAAKDSFDIYSALQRQNRQLERRQGENQELRIQFLERQQRGGRIDPAVVLASNRGAGEVEDLPFGARATADQRRQRRTRSATPTPQPRAVVESSSSSGGEGIVSQAGFQDISSSSAEEVLSRGQRGDTSPFQPRILRGDTPAPDRFGEFATDETAAAALRSQRRQPPRTIQQQEAEEETTDLSSEQLRRVSGGSGSEETQRRGSGAGRLLLASQLVRGAVAADARRIDEAIDDAAAETPRIGERQPEPEPASELEGSGVLLSPPSSDSEFERVLAGSPEAGLSEGEGIIAPAARAVGGGLAAVGGGAIRGLGGIALGAGQGVVGQLPTAGETGAFIGRQGYRGIVAAGGLLAGGARGALAAATEPGTPRIGGQTGATLTYQGQP